MDFSQILFFFCFSHCTIMIMDVFITYWILRAYSQHERWLHDGNHVLWLQCFCCHPAPWGEAQRETGGQQYGILDWLLFNWQIVQFGFLQSIVLEMLQDRKESRWESCLPFRPLCSRLQMLLMLIFFMALFLYDVSSCWESVNSLKQKQSYGISYW